MLDFGYYNMDCMQGMKEFPDNYFDLAIVDPPYGIGYDTQAEKSSGQQYKNAAAKKRTYKGGGWDVKPSRAYFDELVRVSKRQVVWGAITSPTVYQRAGALFVGISVATMR